MLAVIAIVLYAMATPLFWVSAAEGKAKRHAPHATLVHKDGGSDNSGDDGDDNSGDGPGDGNKGPGANANSGPSGEGDANAAATTSNTNAATVSNTGTSAAGADTTTGAAVCPAPATTTSGAAATTASATTSGVAATSNTTTSGAAATTDTATTSGAAAASNHHHEWCAGHDGLRHVDWRRHVGRHDRRAELPAGRPAGPRPDAAGHPDAGDTAGCRRGPRRGAGDTAGRWGRWRRAALGTCQHPCAVALRDHQRTGQHGCPARA
jgi:hypothetical protein